ncbi:hypothetical protein MtrunA17_Chr5g0445871 [Medicago truncatula]|nr:hypothetical protein MtrunA17_Chr5g0445871 [Medicago truncatula]
MYKKFKGLLGRLSGLEDDTKLLKSVGASGGGSNEGKSHVDPMAANIEDRDEEDFLDDELENDTVEEAAPLQTNEDANHTLGVAASTQPQSKGNKDVQGSSSASGRVKLDKNIEVIYLDDDDVGSMSRGVHEKKAFFGFAAKNEVPSPSVATQQKSKFPNAVDTVKRKFSLSDIEISSASSSSSDDSSFLDDLTIRSVVSLERRKKSRQTEQA